MASAEVVVDYRVDEVTVEVTDRGWAPGAPKPPRRRGERARPGRDAGAGRGPGRAVGHRAASRGRVPGVRRAARGAVRVIRVLIADDQDLVRLGLRALVESEDDLALAGEAADGLRAVELARRERPDVVLMDIRMPGIDGIEATRRIVADPDLTGTRVVVLTTFELDEYVFDALRHGASGFLTKDTRPAELLRAIRLVAEGRRCCRRR
ncbi:response regulator transcription factor [Micromonospora sp. M12]